MIQELIRRESERGERLVSLIRAAMHTVTIAGGVLALSLELDPQLRNQLTLLAWSAPAVLAIVWGWYAFVATRPYRRAYGAISVSGDVLTLAAAMAGGALFGQGIATANALGGTPELLGLFFVIASAGVRHDPALCVLAGGLGLVSFGFAAGLSIDASSPTLNGTVDALAAPEAWVARAAIVGFTAAMVTLAARNGRRLAETMGAAMAAEARAVQVFGEYVDESIARAALAGDGVAETREVSVLFTDLRDFTALTERLEPGETLALLNAHYAALIPVVHRHGGTVNKFIGDAIMATFGAPARVLDHARRAVEAGADILRAQDELNARLRAEGRPELAMAVGVNTGPAVLGRLGGADRVEYAVIGDTVNTASRLEGLNKKLGTRLLFSESTRRALGAALPVRELGQHELKGKSKPVSVFTLDAL